MLCGTRNDDDLREAAIDLNRRLHHSYLIRVNSTLIRVLEESLKINLEKQMQII